MGSHLGLSSRQLNAIKRNVGLRRDSKLQFREVLVQWAESHTRPYTWQTILEALYSPAVGQRRLALMLAAAVTNGDYGGRVPDRTPGRVPGRASTGTCDYTSNGHQGGTRKSLPSNNAFLDSLAASFPSLFNATFQVPTRSSVPAPPTPPSSKAMVQRQEKLFNDLCGAVKNTLHKQAVPLKDLNAYLSQHNKGLAISTYSDIDTAIQQHFNYTDWAFLNDLVTTFLPSSPLEKDVSQYRSEVESLLDSLTLQQAASHMEQALPTSGTVTLGFSHRWNNVRVSKLQHLVQVLFHSRYLTRMEVRESSVSWDVPWNLAPDAVLSNSLSVSCTVYLHNFLDAIGITLLAVGERVVYERAGSSDTINEALSASLISGPVEAVALLLAVGGDHTLSLSSGDNAIGRAGKMRKGSSGVTVLHIASHWGHTHTVTSLLRAGADPNLATSQEKRFKKFSKTDEVKLIPTGATPLYCACLKGHRDTVSMLLRYQADPALSTSDGVTPLMGATYEGHHDIVTTLLPTADVNTTDRHGKTALYFASWRGHSNIATTLLRANADPALTTNDGTTPLIIASAKGHTPIIQALLEHGRANIDMKNGRGSTALHLACYHGHTGVAMALLVAKANPALTNNEGVTPLMLASHRGHCDIVDMLLAVSINAQDNNGSTALHQASKNGHLEVVTSLLEAGADPNIVNSNRWTPLMEAASKGHCYIVHTLLQHSAEINHTSSAVGTALMLAVTNGHTDVVHALLDYGADPTITTPNGHSAMTCAQDNRAIMELLQMFPQHFKKSVSQYTLLSELFNDEYEDNTSLGSLMSDNSFLFTRTEPHPHKDSTTRVSVDSGIIVRQKKWSLAERKMILSLHSMY